MSPRTWVARASIGLALSAVLLASCSNGQSANPRPTSTPAPDATVGVHPELARFYDQRLQWEPCGGDFQCASLTVPLDYDKPAGTTLQIALLRSPATGNDRIGSLLVNPGGPGGSGIDYARAARAIVSGSVRSRFDIVGFDPRGVGESTPVDCLSDPELDRFATTDGSPDDVGEEVLLEAQAQALAQGCEAKSGQLLPHVGTRDAARDMDVLRAALGDDKIYYLGKSYGTYLGATYAEEFPNRVGRMVLDGAIDPVLSGEDVAYGQARGFELALNEFVQSCLNGDCPLGTSAPEARTTVSNLLEVIDARPMPTDQEGRDLTESLAVLGIAYPLYLPGEMGFPLLRDALGQALSGDGSGLLALADRYLGRQEDGTYESNQNEVIYAVNCIDKPDVKSVAEVKQLLPRFVEASPRFGEYLAWSGLPCAYWPVPPEPAVEKLAPTGPEPILVVGTVNDPATPYDWAVSLARQLEAGRLLTLEGTGHTAYRQGSSCIDSAVDAYLIDGELPDEDTRCPG